LKTLDLSCNEIKKLENLNFKVSSILFYLIKILIFNYFTSKKNLIELKLFANQIETLENLENLPELQSLQLHSNKITKLSKGLNKLKNLEYMRLDENLIDFIAPSELGNCANLIYLNVSQNKLTSLNVCII